MTTLFQTIPGRPAPSPPETENGSAAKEPFPADIFYGKIEQQDTNVEQNTLKLQLHLQQLQAQAHQLAQQQQQQQQQTNEGGPPTRPAAQTRVRVAMSSVDRPLSPLSLSHERTPLTITFPQPSQPTKTAADNGVYILKSSFYSGFI